MGFHGLNYWAVLVAAIAAFVLGGLWYAPFLFGGSVEEGEWISSG